MEVGRDFSETDISHALASLQIITAAEIAKVREEFPGVDIGQMNLNVEPDLKAPSSDQMSEMVDSPAQLSGEVEMHKPCGACSVAEMPDFMTLSQDSSNGDTVPDDLLSADLIKESSPPILQFAESSENINDEMDIKPAEINSETTPKHTEQTATNLSEKDEALATSPSKSRSRKKEDKAIDHILRALNSLQTTEEKLAALCKKYADLHEEHRTLQSSFKQTQRRLQVVSREKDQLQTEHNKAVMAKGRLESLCRELQKHNKQIKEESIARAKEDEERRKEVSTKFQTTIGEIQSQMRENHDRNVKLKEDNVDLAQKLKELIQQYDLQKQQVDKLKRACDLEGQLNDTKLQQAAVKLEQEREKNKKEIEILLLRTAEANKKAEMHEAQEKQFREQLAMYTEKYKEFQSALNKSNDVFSKFKSEMDKMTKRIKKLEKDTLMWKGQWEKSNKALIEMVEEKQKADKEKANYITKIEKLESLCRALQSQRYSPQPSSNPPTAPPVTSSPPEASTAPSSTGNQPDISPPEIETTNSAKSSSNSEENQGNYDATKTPPNTPNVPSRTSPETIQAAAQGTINGQAESGETTEASHQSEQGTSCELIHHPSQGKSGALLELPDIPSLNVGADRANTQQPRSDAADNGTQENVDISGAAAPVDAVDTWTGINMSSETIATEVAAALDSLQNLPVGSSESDAAREESM